MTGDGPVLLVRTPETRVAERRYILDVVLEEWLGLPYALSFHREPVVWITRAGDPSGISLSMPDTLLSVADADWLTSRSLPSEPLRRTRVEAPELPGAPRSPARESQTPHDLPVLFGDTEARTTWTADEKGLALNVDVLGTAFFFLTAYEDVVRSVRDAYGRFPASESLGVREGFIDRPVVDEAVDLLWMGIEAIWPDVVRRDDPFRLQLTHDVDQPWGVLGRTAPNVLRSIGADLAVRRDPALAGRRLLAVLDGGRGRVDRDPVNTFDFLMDVSEGHGLRSTFYFLAGNVPGEPDFRYRITDPPILDLIGRIRDRGHAIGLHGSHASHGSLERTAFELAALRQACDDLGFQQPSWGVRQHYLRLDAPRTWRIHEAAGLTHDSTFGYADRVGFRAGTARAFTVFDLLDRRALALRERPLIAMDVALFEGMRLGLDEGMARVRELVDRSRRHGGDTVLLFHNNWPIGSRRAERYRRLVSDLA